jgi:cystathionine beta-lyase/cystathionine gamma-synthase
MGDMTAAPFDRVKRRMLRWADNHVEERIMPTIDIDLATKLVHAGEPKPAFAGAVSMPIFQSSTFEYSGETSYHDLKYIRLNNTPNHIALHQKLAAIENAETAVVTSSGMAAISSTLLSLLKSGDHVLCQQCLYGGTYDLITKDLNALGITFDFIDETDSSAWAARLTPQTKVVYVETMTNPLLGVIDLEAVVQFAHAHGLVSVIDNTFASPINFRPIEWGFDVSLHSCSKYLNGHSDLVAGAVIGKSDLIEGVTQTLNHYGGALDPHACFLLHRGMKTLALRMQCQSTSALKIAEFLQGHPKVTRVNYPGLPSHPAYERSYRLFDGFSGMLSFELEGGVASADRFMDRTTIPKVAPSLGGLETLVTRPATTSHAGLTQEERLNQGISDHLIRVSVGIEATADLIQDFEHALA